MNDPRSDDPDALAPAEPEEQAPTGAEPEEPVAEPEVPVAESEEPVAEPEEPVAESEEPLAEPEEPVAEADEAAEQVLESGPVVGTSADVGEPMTETGETFQLGVQTPASQVPPETGVSVLREEEAQLPPTNEAIGAGPTQLVDVPAEEGAPIGEVLEADRDSAMVETPAGEPELVELPDAEPEAAREPAEASSTKAASAVEAEDAETLARDPFRGPGDWYVVHTYAGYENKVKTNLESRIHTMQMEDKIFDVHIPMEDVMEIKGGKKQVVQRKVFPGYLLVKMYYDNDSWYVVRNTPGVTGFVAAGTGSKPTPLSKREVEKILAVKKEEVKPQFRLGFEEGDVVRIISGPFADFNGTISEINLDQSKLKVLVNIFDRETPVELSFDQVAKV
jgi:transcriptional antiterminator NusG